MDSPTLRMKGGSGFTEADRRYSSEVNTEDQRKSQQLTTYVMKEITECKFWKS
jgi:hypothetical protein